MRLILISVIIFFAMPLLAQRQCYVSSVNERSVADKVTGTINISGGTQQGNEISNVFTGNTNLPSNIIRIPVVVHVLYNSSSQNVSDAQVKSQIDALNRDFRRQNKDTVNIPQRFKPFAADMEIEFLLAVVSPDGKSTNGIVRKQTSVKEWGVDDKIKFNATGGDDAWDSKSYLNIWVGYTKKTLGYSSALNGPAERDGIVIAHSVFGTIGKSGSFNMGRTLVHEVGHWLGLKHIWGDDACGDDEVDDTPRQAGFTSGCPNEFRATCGASALGDMYMNYMDFTDDGCMNMFTYGQKLRMRANFNPDGLRYSLLAGKGLDSTNIKESSNEQVPGSEVQITEPGKDSSSISPLLYPNPAESKITINLESKEWIGKDLHILNVNGVRLQKLRITSQTQVIPITSLRQGLYFVILEKADERKVLKFVKSGNSSQ